MAAFNLLDIAQGLKDKVVQGVILNFARQSLVLQRLPFETIDGFIFRAWRMATVTDAQFRSVGNAYTAVKDQFEPTQEGIAIMGDSFDIDRLLKLPGQTEVDSWAENLLRESDRMRYKFMNELINGDVAVDPEGFNGFKTRVTAIGGEQSVSGASNGLDVTASDANRHVFLDKFRRAEFECGHDGVPDLVLTSKDGLLTLEYVARRLGLLDTSKDAFDRTILMFNGIPIEWAGRKGDQSTEIITSTEDPGDAGNDSTSFYFTKFGMPYVLGTQMHSPERIYDQVISDGVTHRTVIEWPSAIAMFHDKGIVRLKDVIPAT